MTSTSASAISLMTRSGAELATAKADAGTAAAFVERGGKIGARCADGGDKAKEDSGEHRNAEGEKQDVSIERHGRADFADARNSSGVDTDSSRANPGEPENKAKQTPPSESARLSVSNCRMIWPRPAPRAARVASSRFLDEALDQQQIGNIGAGDQQDKADGSEQDQQGRSGYRRSSIPGERPRRNRPGGRVLPG